MEIRQTLMETAIGDACDDDIDGDGVVNESDNCLRIENGEQADLDTDGIGDACDDDLDGDGVANLADNCPAAENGEQIDTDSDDIGDACDADDDNDAVDDIDDNCPLVINPNQLDSDSAPTGSISAIGAGNFRRLTPASNQLPLDDDEASGFIDIGFRFQFFGNAYDRLQIGSNGIISFTGDNASSWQRQDLFDPNTTNGVVAACWTDLAPNTVRYELIGRAPNREFAVSWDANGYQGAMGGTSQVVLKEQGGGELLVARCNPEGTQGIEDQTGARRAVTEGEPQPALVFETALASDGVGDM